MRELRFKVSGQNIIKDSNCDFTGIIAGTSNYLYTSFAFDSEWSGAVKVAVFKRLNDEYPVMIEGDKCIIPKEALTWRSFKVRVVGQIEKTRITTNFVTVEQEVE